MGVRHPQWPSPGRAVGRPMHPDVRCRQCASAQPQGQRWRTLLPLASPQSDFEEGRLSGVRPEKGHIPPPEGCDRPADNRRRRGGVAPPPRPLDQDFIVGKNEKYFQKQILIWAIFGFRPPPPLLIHPMPSPPPPPPPRPWTPGVAMADGTCRDVGLCCGGAIHTIPRCCPLLHQRLTASRR